MLSNTYTVTKLHTSTTTKGVDALIEQLEKDKINAKSGRSRYFIEKKKYHKNSSDYRNNTIWFILISGFLYQELLNHTFHVLL